MDLTIEKNIPAPSKEDTWRGKIEVLAIGDSFPFPEDKRNSVANTVSLYFHRQTNKRFTISTKDQERGFARLWRVDDEEVKAQL